VPDPVPSRSGGFQDTKLHERGDPVVESDFRDLAVLDTEDGRTREVHLPTGCRRQLASEKIAERRSGVGPATFPSTDDMIALGDEIGSAPELEVRKRGAEVIMKFRTSSRPRRGACSEYWSSILGAASSSMTFGFQGLPQKPSNQRPTTPLLSCSRDIFDSPDAVQKGFAPRVNRPASSERSPSPRRTAIAWRG